MFNFYLNTWGYFFAPIAISLMFKKYYKLNFRCLSYEIIASSAVAISFAVLIFFYQWGESRFTYYIWPWAMISFFWVINPIKKIKMTFVLSSLLIIFSFLTPDNLWAPSLRSISINNWAVNFFGSASVDRGFDSCKDGSCHNNLFLITSDTYVNATMKFNFLIKQLREDDFENL
jgi:hypothetical protein